MTSFPIFIDMADFSLTAKYQNDGNDIVLSWSKIYPAPYSVYSSDFVDGPWSLIGTTNAGNFSLSNVSSKAYFFQVKSAKFKPTTNQQYISNITSISPSKNIEVNDVSYFVKTKVSLTAPELGLESDTANSQVALSWEGVKDAAFYSVFRNDTTTGQKIHLGDTNTTNFNDSTPFTTARSNPPIYTYTVIAKVPTLYGPESNAKNYYLSSDIGIDPVLGPPFPPFQYSMSLATDTVTQPRILWNVPDVGIGYPRLGGFTQDTGFSGVDLVYWYSQTSDIQDSTGVYVYNGVVPNTPTPQYVFVARHNYVYAVFGDGSGNIGDQPSDKVMLLNDAGGGNLSSFVGGAVITFAGGNPTGSQSIFYDANSVEQINGFSLYRKSTPFTTPAGTVEGTLIATPSDSDRSYADSASSPCYYRLIGHTTYFDFPYNDASLLSGFWTNWKLNTSSFVQIGNNDNFPASEGRCNMAEAVIGNKIYLYGGRIQGGTPRSTIFTASVDRPEKVGDAVTHLPDPLFAQKLLVIGAKMYMYGGQGASGQVTNSIYTASVTDPLTWRNSGATLPINIVDHAMFVIDNKIYMMGGGNGNGFNRTIYTASISTPLVFGSAASMSFTASQLSVVQCNDSLIAYGGKTNLSNPSPYVYTSSRSNPLVWGSGSANGMPGGAPNTALAIGTRHFQLGGILPASSPNIWLFESTNASSSADTGKSTTNLSPFGQSTLCYSSSNGKAYVATYGGSSADGSSFVVAWVATGSVTPIVSTVPDSNYVDMPTWRTLAPFFTAT